MLNIVSVNPFPLHISTISYWHKQAKLTSNTVDKQKQNNYINDSGSKYWQQLASIACACNKASVIRSYSIHVGNLKKNNNGT